MTAAAEDSRVVVVSPRIEDHTSLRKIFRHSPWELLGAFTGRDGLRCLRDHYLVPVVICSDTLPDGDWKLVLGELDPVPARPSFIVAARAADRRLWAEAFSLGAFDLLLAAPFDAFEVMRVTESAWLAWNRAREQSAGPRIGRDLGWSQEDTGVQVLTAGSLV